MDTRGKGSFARSSLRGEALGRLAPPDYLSNDRSGIIPGGQDGPLSIIAPTTTPRSILCLPAPDVARARSICSGRLRNLRRDTVVRLSRPHTVPADRPVCPRLPLTGAYLPSERANSV